jgi:hypothetical protein
MSQILHLFSYFRSDSDLNMDSISYVNRIRLGIDIINMRSESSDMLSDDEYPDSDTDRFKLR